MLKPTPSKLRGAVAGHGMGAAGEDAGGAHSLTLWAQSPLEWGEQIPLVDHPVIKPNNVCFFVFCFFCSFK